MTHENDRPPTSTPYRYKVWVKVEVERVGNEELDEYETIWRPPWPSPVFTTTIEAEAIVVAEKIFDDLDSIDKEEP